MADYGCLYETGAWGRWRKVEGGCDSLTFSSNLYIKIPTISHVSLNFNIYLPFSHGDGLSYLYLPIRLVDMRYPYFQLSSMSEVVRYESESKLGRYAVRIIPCSVIFYHVLAPYKNYLLVFPSIKPYLWVLLIRKSVYSQWAHQII